MNARYCPCFAVNLGFVATTIGRTAARGSFVRVLVQETAELITHRIKEAPNLAVIAMVGLGSHTAEQIVDVVKRQINSEP